MKKDWLTSRDIVPMPPIDPILYCHKHHCKTSEFLNFIDIVAPALHNCKWNNIRPSLPLLWKPAHFIWGLFEQGLKRSPQGLAKGINNSITWEFKWEDRMKCHLGIIMQNRRSAEGKTMLKYNLCVLILLSFYILKAQYKNKYDKGINASSIISMKITPHLFSGYCHVWVINGM